MIEPSETFWSRNLECESHAIYSKTFNEKLSCELKSNHLSAETFYEANEPKLNKSIGALTKKKKKNKHDQIFMHKYE